MKNLSEKELQLMTHLWKIKRGFMKDIVDQFDEPAPAYTTISTLLNRLIAKKHVGFKLNGRDKEYYPVLKKPAYFNSEFDKMIRNFFDNSTAQFASFFTENSDLSIQQLEELRGMVDQQIEKKNKKP